MPLVGVLPSTAGNASITVSTAAVGISSRPNTTGIKAGAAICYVDDQPIRYWDNGNTPTASVGILVQAGGVIVLAHRTAVLNFLAIRQGATDATLRVEYGIEYRA